MDWEPFPDEWYLKNYGCLPHQLSQPSQTGLSVNNIGVPIAGLSGDKDSKSMTFERGYPQNDPAMERWQWIQQQQNAGQSKSCTEPEPMDWEPFPDEWYLKNYGCLPQDLSQPSQSGLSSNNIGVPISGLSAHKLGTDLQKILFSTTEGKPFNPISEFGAIRSFPTKNGQVSFVNQWSNACQANSFGKTQSAQNSFGYAINTTNSFEQNFQKNGYPTQPQSQAFAVRKRCGIPHLFVK